MSNSETAALAPIGHNNPPLPQSIALVEGDFAIIVTDYLGAEHKKWPEAAAALLEEARQLPKEIPDDETKGKVASLIKRIRDTAKMLDGIHAKEKQPYKRGGEAVDQFFFGLIDKLARRAKTNNPGAADILNARLTDYDNRKLAEERARRDREAAETARLAREAQDRAEATRKDEERKQREADEAAAAAERARNPERKDEKIAAAQEVRQEAQQQGAVADQAKVDAEVVTARAQDAYHATLTSSADIMRTRIGEGTLATMGVEKYAEIINRDELDKAALWPFIPLADLEKALRGWARNTDYRQSMPGADVGRRNKSTVR